MFEELMQNNNLLSIRVKELEKELKKLKKELEKSFKK